MGEVVFFVFFALAAVWVAFVFLTKAGRGFMFGGTIVHTWDGVTGKRKIYTSRVKVHAVDAAPTLRFVGLEIATSSIGSYQMIPISLPKAEALELARLIQEAANYRSES